MSPDESRGPWTQASGIWTPTFIGVTRSWADPPHRICNPRRSPVGANPSDNTHPSRLRSSNARIVSFARRVPPRPDVPDLGARGDRAAALLRRDAVLPRGGLSGDDRRR